MSSGPHGRFENKRHQLRTLRLISSPNVYIGSRYSEKLSDQNRPISDQIWIRLLQCVTCVHAIIAAIIVILPYTHSTSSPDHVRCPVIAGAKVKDVCNSASARDHVSANFHGL